ncbi:MAG: hypothetical protein E7346_03985 [Clostridiales bacterium]|nr:hypothetical protein [Clostridiales bacterium]
MIDIHAHILPEVDDGSRSMEESLALLKESSQQGISDVVLTPHYRGNYLTERKELEEKFAALKEKAEQAGIPVRLYLGQEIYLDKDFKEFITTTETLDLNGSGYILVEFDFYEDTDIADVVYELNGLGYKKVIVAHFERYFHADLSDARSVKDVGGYIQVNADSILGKEGRAIKKKVMALFENGLVDFVAGDVHHNRENCMAKAFKVIKRKFGEIVANKVFLKNASKIIKG